MLHGMLTYELLGSGKSGNNKATSKWLFDERVIFSELNLKTTQLLDSRQQQTNVVQPNMNQAPTQNSTQARNKKPIKKKDEADLM